MSGPFDFDEHARYMSLDDHENAPALDLAMSEASMMELVTRHKDPIR